MPRFLLAAALLVALAIPVVAPTAVAAATCDGRAATRVGTNAADVLIGTPGPDVFVARGGDDVIRGKGGRDRICGGEGWDSIDGGSGDDRLFGAGGDDAITGEDGNDLIDGGAGTDDCTQGPGSGDIKRCERANLKVEVTSPESVSEGLSVDFTITVTNLGPDPTAYQLAKVNDNNSSSCGGADGGIFERPELQPGEQHQEVHSRTCTVVGFGFSDVSLTVTVTPRAHDRRIGNNRDESTTVLVPT